MAHKHNRRRIRPRLRQHRELHPDLSNLDSELSLSSTSDDSDALLKISIARHLTSIKNPTTARHWQNRYTAWQNRQVAQRREAVDIQRQQLRIYGGEPGDDVGLCLKMDEMFDGMEWVDSLD